MFSFYGFGFIFVIILKVVSNSSPIEEKNEKLPLQAFQQIMNNPIINLNSRAPVDLYNWKGLSGTETKNKIDVGDEINKLNSTYLYQLNWPSKQRKLGAVSGVTFDKSGNTVIFHRVDRIWSAETFNQNNQFTQQSLGKIPENTIIAYNRKSGKIVYEWGKNLFYMPHGITVDSEDNTWVTDVALHQVMKFGKRGSGNKPLMVLGDALKPGTSKTTFCKPTSVAVLPEGDFFVADGYCNTRIMKFSKTGESILIWGQNSFQGHAYEYAPMNFFAVPHALTLASDLGLICVADRENGRVQCFNSKNGASHSEYHSEIVGDRLFSVAYAPINGGQLYVVNGPVNVPTPHEVRGYIINMKTKEVVGKFGPNNTQFSNPHDIAVTSDGNEIYVAELDPSRVHKFYSQRSKLSMSITKPTITDVNSASAVENDISQASSTKTPPPPGSTALLVIGLITFFGLFTFGTIVLITRKRTRGGKRNRRHAWDFPTSTNTEGFKLGNLLSERRNKHKFEKLDQNASDEEPETTILNTQFT